MKTVNKIKLGIFVLSGITFLILGLYYIGSKRNIFHSTINVRATFNNVDGLLPGNNVRFNGINIGTVSEVTAIADTSIKVDFTIDKDVTKYISVYAIASIGTDGLLGNKLVNIICEKNGQSVKEGDELLSQNSIRMENTLRTLTITNDNLKVISENLKSVSDKLNNSHSLWGLLADTIVSENVKSAVVNIKVASNSTALLTGNLKNISEDIKNGKGSLGALIPDTTLSGKINQVIVKLGKVSDTVAYITGDFSKISKRLEQGQGSVGVLLRDTSFVHNLNTSVNNINKGTILLNEDLEALRHSWPFRKYFRKKEKEKRK